MNERTSARVSRIAGKILEMKLGLLDKAEFEITSGLKWADIRALAASCLTQTPTKPKRKVGPWTPRRPKKAGRA